MISEKIFHSRILQKLSAGGMSKVYPAEDTRLDVAELLEGKELHAPLNEGALLVRRCLDFAQQITQGLSAAPEKGIIHRDLKPEK